MTACRYVTFLLFVTIVIRVPLVVWTTPGMALPGELWELLNSASTLPVSTLWTGKWYSWSSHSVRYLNKVRGHHSISLFTEGLDFMSFSILQSESSLGCHWPGTSWCRRKWLTCWQRSPSGCSHVWPWEDLSMRRSESSLSVLFWPLKSE